jgi:hypothetical protein
MGVHLGVDESLPGAKHRKNGENTGLESLSSYLELRTIQWHEKREEQAQQFLDQFVRQNVAEISEIPYEEHIKSIVLPPAERAIYLELETHLKSLDMKSKSAQKSKNKSTGDRESRMYECFYREVEWIRIGKTSSLFYLVFLYSLFLQAAGPRRLGKCRGGAIETVLLSFRHSWELDHCA